MRESVSLRLPLRAPFPSGPRQSTSEVRGTALVATAGTREVLKLCLALSVGDFSNKFPALQSQTVYCQWRRIGSTITCRLRSQGLYWMDGRAKGSNNTWLYALPDSPLCYQTTTARIGGLIARAPSDILTRKWPPGMTTGSCPSLNAMYSTFLEADPSPPGSL